MVERGRFRSAIPVVVLTAILGAWCCPPESDAAHDLSQDCYTCHNIRSGQVWQNSYSIWSGKSIGMRPYSRPITCEVCHTDYGLKFNNVPANASRHPVRIIAGDNTLADNNVYGASPASIDCREMLRGAGPVAPR